VLTVLLITIFPFYIQKLVSWFRFFRDLQLQIVEIIVADISTFEKDASYDRIHCIGMFEVGEFHATLGM
jgi:cyclopropane fatty-acyl-phospholipid synthase-like methyltransferase